MTIDYIPGTTSNLVGDPSEGGAFSSGNKQELSGANTAAANAATSATAASASATAANLSKESATSSESNAQSYKTLAETAATTATTKASEASTSATNAAASYDSFDDRYLGAKGSAPSADNDGNALIVGALYFNTTSNTMNVWNGSAWAIAAVDGSTILLKAQNLADLPSASTARTNLGLGTMALATAADYAPLAGATFTGNVTAPEFIGVLQGETVFKAKAGEALAKGDAVYVSGVSGSLPVVSKADANGSNTSPAFGLAAATTANNGTLDVITAGELKNFDTSGFSLGDTLYLSTTPGALTATPPAGEGSVIQNMGKVEREHASVGSILVVGSGRTAATPNLNNGNIFIGNSSNKAVTSSFNTLADARIANNIIDEDGFGTNSATRAPSQQSVKQYVADQTANIQGDITKVTPGTGLLGGGETGDVGVRIDSSVVVTKTGAATMTNKTLNVPTINTPDINGGTLDGAVIGGATPAAGSFTTLDSSSTITSTRADNGTGLHLISTDADAASGPIIKFERDSASPADDDITGIVNFTANDDGDNNTTFVQFLTKITDASDGSESGHLEIKTQQGGTFRPAITVDTVGGQAEVNINRFSADIDFRVEGSGQPALLFAEAGTNRIGIKTASPSVELEVNGGAKFTTAEVTGLLSGSDITLTDSNPKITFIDSDGTNQTTEQVQAGGSFVTTVRNDTSHGSIDFKSNNGTNNLLRFRVATDGGFNLYENDGSTIGVKWDAPNGRLGIGTTSPDTALSVAGKITTTEGIYLGGTAAANLLDDYEEGTFTPVLSDASSGGTNASAANEYGYYTKIGDTVNIIINFTNIDTDGMTATNSLFIQSLPFASSATIRQAQTVYVSQIGGGLANTSTGIQVLLNPSSSVLEMKNLTYGGGTSGLEVSAINTNGAGDLWFNLTYKA